jgi:AhpC/TSA family
MRVRRSLILAAGLLGLAPLAASAGYSPTDMLKGFRPSMPGVEYDTPPDDAAIKACKVENVMTPEQKIIGYALRDGQGKLLRKFVDTNRIKDANGDTHLDLWSYYKDGFEVYRDVDTDEDGRANEAHWLNSGGSRIAIVEPGAGGKGYRVASWKRISAEEASKVLVQAITTGDVDLLASVIATPEELKAIGVPKDVSDKVAKGAGSRQAQYEALVNSKKLKGWDRSTTWSRFDGAIPHGMPVDPALGLSKEILLYENPVVWVQPPNPEKNAAGMAYLQAADVIKIGEAWKFTDLPQAVDPAGQPPSLEGGLRTALIGRGPIDDKSEVEIVDLLAALAKYDLEHAPRPNSSRKDVAEYHFGRIEKLKAIAATTKAPETKLIHNKEIVNCFAEAYRMGFYPSGPELMTKLANKEGGKLASYANYRKIMAVFAYESEQPGADYFALQKQTMTDLEKFKADFPKAEEVAEALLQQGMMSEANNNDDESRKYYRELLKKYADAEPGKWAKGALKRLDLVGAPLDLSGLNAGGKRVSSTAYKGKTLLVVFWSTSAEVFIKDLPELNRLLAKYQPKGFEILGVNLDTDKDALAAFLEQSKLPWVQILEPEGMSGRLAVEYGLLGQPTMILADSSGKVVSRGVKSIVELEKHLEKLLSGSPEVNLGNK